MNKQILSDLTFNFACLSVFITSLQVAVQKLCAGSYQWHCSVDLMYHMLILPPSSPISHTSPRTLFSTHLSLVHERKSSVIIRILFWLCSSGSSAPCLSLWRNTTAKAHATCLAGVILVCGGLDLRIEPHLHFNFIFHTIASTILTTLCLCNGPW